MREGEKLLFLLIDGAHARFVEWSRDKGDFITIRRISGEERLKALRAEQRDEPAAGRSFESASAGRHGLGREDAYRRAKEAFAADVAHALAESDIGSVVLAAPPRLLEAIRASLPPRIKVVAQIGKDLIKTPDHELEPWLGPSALAKVR